jgi:hypothetical protein
MWSRRKNRWVLLSLSSYNMIKEMLMSYISCPWLMLGRFRGAIVAVFCVLLIAAQCNTDSEEVPKVGELKMYPPAGTALDPGQEVSLWVDSTNLVAPIYIWRIRFGDQLLIEEQGRRSFSFSAPDRPGTYEVSLEVVDRGVALGPTPLLITVAEVHVEALPTLPHTPTPLLSTPTNTPTPVLTPTLTKLPTSTTTDTPTPTPTLTATPIPTNTPIPTVTPTPTLYNAPTLTAPENGVHVNGTFPPLDWHWDGELGENEYFEVRVWHENITTYRPALGWVKVPHFDYNITQELQGKYYWTVLVVEGQDARTKDWWRPEAFPYPVWDGKLVRELGPEGEVGFFFYVPPPDICKNCGHSPISLPPIEP